MVMSTKFLQKIVQRVKGMSSLNFALLVTMIFVTSSLIGLGATIISWQHKDAKSPVTSPNKAESLQATDNHNNQSKAPSQTSTNENTKTTPYSAAPKSSPTVTPAPTCNQAIADQATNQYTASRNAASDNHFAIWNQIADDPSISAQEREFRLASEDLRWADEVDQIKHEYNITLLNANCSGIR